MPLTEDPLPRWLPRTRIWPNLTRWGIEGLAAVLEARVVELGGSVRILTAVDRAVLLEREIAFEQQRKKFLSSADGVIAARGSFAEIEKGLRTAVDRISNTSSQIDLAINNEGPPCVIRGRGITLSVFFDCYENTLDDCELNIELLEGRPYRRDPAVVSMPRRTTEAYTFDLRAGPQYGWVNKQGRFLTGAQLTEHILNLALDAVREIHIGGT